jgi:hypothetical protein
MGRMVQLCRMQLCIPSRTYTVRIWKPLFAPQAALPHSDGDTYGDIIHSHVIPMPTANPPYTHGSLRRRTPTVSSSAQTLTTHRMASRSIRDVACPCHVGGVKRR